jgi:hypothetical protein
VLIDGREEQILAENLPKMEICPKGTPKKSTLIVKIYYELPGILCYNDEDGGRPPKEAIVLTRRIKE